MPAFLGHAGVSGSDERQEIKGEEGVGVIEEQGVEDGRKRKAVRGRESKPGMIYMPVVIVV